MRQLPKLTLLAIWCAPVGISAWAAGIPDHLKCYKIRDPLLLRGVLDMDTPQFGADPGCTVSKAKLFCVPATKVVQSIEDRITGPITPLPVTGMPTSDDRVCYKLKCPVLPADQLVTDQFGTRTLDLIKTSYVCTPAVKGAAYCGDGVVSNGEECDDTDLGGATCESEGFASGTLACGDACKLDTSRCVATTVPGCGNGVRDGVEQCDGSDTGGVTCESLGFAAGTLGCSAGCGFDVSTCVAPTTTTSSSTTTTTGPDGELVVTDPTTGLMWELKRNMDGLPNYADPHDADNRYEWCKDDVPDDGTCDSPDNQPDGSAYTLFLATLNTPPCFAGFCNWRLPANELLQSLSDTTRPGCSIGAVPCSDPLLDPTATPFAYISSTTYPYPYPCPDCSAYAYIVEFSSGLVGYGNKGGEFFVRAVRTGS